MGEALAPIDIAAVGSVEVADDPADRGTLTIRDRAVQKVAVAAALNVGGVVRSSRGIGKLALRELPRADVVVTGDHIRASLEVAVTWGSPLSETAGAIRRSVQRGLADMSGLVVDGVDVHITSVVVSPPEERHRTLA